MIVKAVRFIFALILLFVILYLGKWISHIFPIGIPDSIWGFLILFSLLVLKIVRVEWIFPASRPILRYMTLFFLPVCAGVIEQTEVLKAHLNSLIWANFFSTVLSLVVIGYLAQWLFYKGEKSHE